MYITHINKTFDGDTFFPDVNYSLWKQTELFSNKADKKNPIDFVVKKYDK
jgi:hypothetical protein